ncbi:MAG: PDZ domain-containing protein [Elusimicrobiota bacterium]|jgi:carboxyl-terminal processing protease|nr:PDZ domain-containing protein [Elusimicrobiota bacterium]
MKNIISKIILFFMLFQIANVSNVYAADETYDKLKIMIDVMEMISEHYVDDKNTKDMAAGAIRGVVGTLDPFSQYMEEKAYKDMKSETEGSFSGIGIQIAAKNGYVTVISPIPDSPAYKAGVLPGDKIYKIDNKSAVGMTVEEAVSLMKGKFGTKVTVTMLRDGVPDPIEFALKRDKIKIVTVRSALLDNNIAYVRLSEFNAQSARDIEQALDDFAKQVKIKGIILDLRNNPGGLVDSAIAIISMFVKDKTTTLTTRGRHKKLIQEYHTSGDAKYPNEPLIILVNRGSASASEIVSGSLQDFKRALILGANTFGKGSVQTIFPLSDGTALRLTIAKYYLPSGRPITRGENPNDRNGITPDIEFKLSIEDEIRLYVESNKVFVDPQKAKIEIIDKDQAQKESEDNKKETAGGKQDVKKTQIKDKVETIKIEDDVLKRAVDIIKANKVKEYINSSKALDADKLAQKEERAKEAENAKKQKEEAEKLNKEKSNKLEVDKIDKSMPKK